jgi:uncharacterized membrane protein
MHSHKTITSKAVVLAGIFFLCLFTVSNAFAYDYQITEIQPPAGYTASRAMGINNLGQVVGRFYNIDTATGDAVDRHAFVWDKNDGASLLSTLAGETSAWAINDNGFVAGYSYNGAGKQRAALWDLESGTVDDLGAFRNSSTGVYGESSTAYGINNLDQVVGSADIPNNANDFTPFHAFFDDVNGMVDLGTFTTNQPDWQNGYSIAYYINNQSEVVGIAHDDSWAFLPFIYDETNGMQALQRDNAYLAGEWYAVVINDSGLIGGHVIAATNQSLPYYWPNKSSAPVKITMPESFPYGEIYGINASGQMVGIMWSSDQEGATEHAFIFDVRRGIRDLNDLIDPAAGWVLTFARDINDRGLVVGYGEMNSQKRGYVFSPRRVEADFNGDGKTDTLWQNKATGEVQVWLMNGVPQTTWSLGSLPLDWKVVGYSDFNGDGKSDVLWRNASTGKTSVWLMDGQSLVKATGFPGTLGLDWVIVERVDFSGDGKTDILWRNKATGQVQAWLMDGVKQTTWPLGSPTLDWEILGCSDFDGDGRGDVLWRNASTGKTSVWLMDGQSLVRTIGSPGTLGLEWGIVERADFSGDGKADILWRNKATGEVQVWLMNGVTQTIWLAGSPLLDWEVVGCFDFNGDGKSDVLWRNASTGKTAVWLMDGQSLLKTTGSLGSLGLEWEMVECADFSGDDKVDILWRNKTTGQVQVWLMDGATPAIWSVGTPLLVLQVVRCSDFNGDGMSDVLWRNTNTGKTSVWLMNGQSLLKTAVSLESLALDWEIQ